MARITLKELEQALQAVEPAVLLRPPRLVRRVIKQHSKVRCIGLRVPHRRSHVLATEELLQIAPRDELGLSPTAPLPPTTILLASPRPATLATTPRATLLLRYWRTLFHARVHLAVEQKLQAAGIGPAGIRARIEAIGTVEFEEARTVLQQDSYLLHPQDDREVYVELAAVYLELRSFAPTLLPWYFPGLGHGERLEAVLAEDVDGYQLLQETRLAGAPEPTIPDASVADTVEMPESATADTPEGQPSPWRYQYWQGRAHRASRARNLVRAALAWRRAAWVAPAEKREQARAAAEAALETLATRLCRALVLDEWDEVQWRDGLLPLLEPAARGIWSPEARLLYDVQQAWIVIDRDLYAVNLLGWMLSRGRRPLTRALPWHRPVLAVRHLRRAARRLYGARVSGQAREHLADLLRDACNLTEERICDGLRPRILGALEEAGMVPRDLTEEIARRKLVEELLDRITERGLLNLGDLRDAVSRNNIKLPDLSGPIEFFRGDRLLQADARLAVALEGIYRGGEIYLRWLHRLSSLAFGTPVGRFLTRYVALPFGGAFVALEGVQHFLKPLVRALFGVRIRIVSPLSVVLLGIFLLGLLYSPDVRRRVWEVLRGLFGIARGLLIDLPTWVYQLKGLRAFLGSRPVVLFGRYVLRPALLAAGVGGIAWLDGLRGRTLLEVVAAAFVGANLVGNTRFGRDVEEAALDLLLRLWQHLHFDLLPGLFRSVMEVFKRGAEVIDRALYTVDEWLRFRRGEGWRSLLAKALLGPIWFLVAYLVRFCSTVLIEPQVNPIKHFPVVTVSHKLVLGLFVPRFTQILALTLEPALAGTVAVSVGTAIPGVFGFLVWEVKENWRLYRANQPATLRPVPVGHHGETVLRLLRPGFHSGTLPRLYAHLRRAGRVARSTGDWTAVRKYRASLERLQASLRHFVQRELLALLLESVRWNGAGLQVGDPFTSTNRIRLHLSQPGQAEAGLEIVFEQHKGRLLAGIPRADLLGHLTVEQRVALEDALAGLYKRAGVELVRLPIGTDVGSETEVPLLLFAEVAITWEKWVQTWKRDQEGEETTTPLLGRVHLLPSATSEECRRPVDLPPAPG